MKTQIEITMGNDECFSYLYKQLKALFGEKVQVYIRGSWVDKYNENTELLSWAWVSVERNVFIQYEIVMGEKDKSKRVTEYPYRYKNLSPNSEIMLKVDSSE